FGIPLPEVRTDFYGHRRDTLRPTVGAVEVAHIPYDMFADVRKYALPGGAFSCDAGKLNGDADPDIAVPVYDQKQVLVFTKQSGSRSFSQSSTVFTDIRPVVVKVSDLDGDGSNDLIVAGDTGAVQIFWGDGLGAFSPPTNVATPGRVRSLLRGPDYAG